MTAQIKAVLAKSSVQAILALLLVGTFCGLAIARDSIPEAVTAVVGAIVGYYFRASTERP